MRYVIVTAADIAAQPGAPLSAEYWATRNDGESYPDWQRRKEAGTELAKARRSLDLAVQQLARARELMGTDDEPSAELHSGIPTDRKDRS